MDLTPIYRIEYFLDAIINGTTPPTPLFRVEYYLAKIAGADVEIPEPIYRIEFYLAKLCGEDVEIPTPLYRIEYYLAKLCGEDVEIPDPIYRVEFWLFEWCGGGGIEKTVTGNPIHITDALAKPVQALSIALEPIQDLHGYDAPWPAGGGKQLYNSATFSTVKLGTITCTNNGDGSFTFNADEADTVDRYFDIFNNQFSENAGGNPLPSAEYRLTGTPSGGGSNTYTMYVRPSYSNDSGAGITFTNSVIGGSILIKAGYRPQNLVFRPMIRLASNGDDTFAPYSNICPIIGWTGVSVPMAGVNLLDPIKQTEDLSTRKRWYWSDGFLLKANTPYTFTEFHEGSGTITVYFMPMGSVVPLAAGSHSVTYTPSADTLVRFQAERSGGIPDGTVFQLSVGSAASDYEEYRGNSYPIPLGQTVYGCVVDTVTGVATVTHGIDTYNGNGTEWTVMTGTGYIQFYTYNPLCKNSLSLLSNLFPTISTSERDSKNGVVSFNDRAFRISLTTAFAQANNITDGASFNSWLENNPLQIYYPLDTPFEISLTPEEITLLEGENNVWSDGTITMTYLADGNASDVEALNILLGGRYVNNHGEDEPTDREALDILLGGNTR